MTKYDHRIWTAVLQSFEDNIKMYLRDLMDLREIGRENVD